MNNFWIGAIAGTLFWLLCILLIAMWNSAVESKARDLLTQQRTEEIEAEKRHASFERT